MQKISISFLVVFISCSASFAQETKKPVEPVKTKIDAFVSRTGRLTKFTDYNLPDIKSSYEKSETRIRKINIAGATSGFFYQIEKHGQYSKSVASIEYADLLEVIKAIKSLKEQVEQDIAGNPDYLENKFVTDDGFAVGYYVDKGKAKWYLQLEKYGSDNTIYISDINTIETAFGSAKTKIDELK